MTNLTIEQNTSAVENVNSAVIDKLYTLSQDQNIQTQLQGNIITTAAYEDAVTYLRQKYPNLTITIQDNNYYIRFADSEVERVLVEKSISSDGIGISKNDALLLSKFPSDLFMNNTTIQTFDELGQFGNIEIGQRCFSGATNLRSIDLSKVTKISGYQTFKDCTSLNIKLNIPNLISLGNFSFIGSGITEIENLGNIIKIPGFNAGSFSSCKNLTKVTLPPSCIELGDGAFAGCSNLSIIGPMNYLTSVGRTSLKSFSTIESILNFENVTYWKTPFSENGSPNNKTRVKQMYLPKLKSTDPNQANYYRVGNLYYRSSDFGDISTDLIYFRDIEKFYGPSFIKTQCTALVINNTTPPVWCNGKNRTDEQVETDSVSNGYTYEISRTAIFAQSSITSIYVPESALSTYQNNSDWSAVADKLKALSTLPRVATEEDLQADQIALIEAYM